MSEQSNGLQLSEASMITHQVQLTVPAISSGGYGSVPQSPVPAATPSSLTPIVRAPTFAPQQPRPSFPQQQLAPRPASEHMLPPMQPPRQQFVQPHQVPQPIRPPKPKRQRPSKRKTAPAPVPAAVDSLSGGGPSMLPPPSTSVTNMVSTTPKIPRPKLSAAALKQKQEDELYSRKMYFLKRTTKSLVFKNAALCDEVARLNQRIHTVQEERKLLAKRMQHHERVRLKKQLVQQKKAASLLAMRAQQSSSVPQPFPSADQPQVQISSS